MRAGPRKALLAALILAFLAFLAVTLFVKWRFNIDMQRARAHAAQGGVLLQTHCGAIEYQESGSEVPLQALRVPTLLISARDDRYGTFATAQYTASHIPGSRFIGFDQGGHTWVGHNDKGKEAIRSAVIKAGQP